jgi:pimeloyl-ACP methyl ester carboxylesterase
MMRLFAAAVAALLTAGCTLTLDESRFLHPGASANLDDLAKWPQPATHVFLKTSDGVQLHAIRATRKDAVAEVLYFGGDAFRADAYGSSVARTLGNAKVNLLIVDYRGYGRSEGRPTVAALRRDAVFAYDSLRNETKLPIVVHGVSFGSFIAAYVAAARQPAGLILESTAPTVREWAKIHAPFWTRVKLPSILSAQDNSARLRTYRNALLLVAGEQDEVTPPSFARKLMATSASADRRLVIAKNGRHGNAMEQPEAIEAYRRLIDSVALRP